MLLADVAGHGEPAAQVASELRGLVRRYINSIRPRKLFEEVNADFTKVSAEDRFATSIVNSYFMPTSTLSICNAGHPTPLIHRARDGHWEPIEVEHRSDDMPLGIVEASKYTQLDIQVEAGDLVLCYTDGVIESLNGDGKQLGTGGLRQLLESLPADRPARLLAKVVKHLGAHSGGGVQEDDVTMLLYRIADRGLPLRDNLLAPLRWLKGLFTGE
jgi:serine phosphatase RsbU (regulator of sigma subunit)